MKTAKFGTITRNRAEKKIDSLREEENEHWDWREEIKKIDSSKHKPVVGNVSIDPRLREPTLEEINILIEQSKDYWERARVAQRTELQESETTPNTVACLVERCVAHGKVFASSASLKAHMRLHIGMLYSNHKTLTSICFLRLKMLSNNIFISHKDGILFFF